MICGVGCRCGLDLALLWLWHRLAAVAQIPPPSLGTSICRGCGPKKTKTKQNEKPKKPEKTKPKSKSKQQTLRTYLPSLKFQRLTPTFRQNLQEFTYSKHPQKRTAQ